MAKGKVILRVEGLDGQVELMADRVVIFRAGWWNAISHGFNSKREIPLGAISEVTFKDASKLFPGSIEFMRGGQSAPAETGKGMKKAKNLNAVKFNRKQHEQFETLKEKVFELMHQQVRQRS